MAHWCDPELNPKLLSFCRHYGCVLAPCLPRPPEHKGKNKRGNACLKSSVWGGGLSHPAILATDMGFCYGDATSRPTWPIAVDFKKDSHGEFFGPEHP